MADADQTSSAAVADYRSAVLEAWKAIDPPSTRRPLTATDRNLLDRLCQRGTPLIIVLAALRLAYLRRRQRPPHLEPLQPVRSLHYFLPVIDELAGASPDYLQTILDRPAAVQIPTIFDDR